MEIKTKFDIGDLVKVDGDRDYVFYVDGIRINKRKEIFYHLGGFLGLVAEKYLSKEILDQTESDWLENTLAPFKNNIKYICKTSCGETECAIVFTQKNGEEFWLPKFDRDSMYKNMEVNKKYTLKELGLFYGN